MLLNNSCLHMRQIMSTNFPAAVTQLFQHRLPQFTSISSASAPDEGKFEKKGKKLRSFRLKAFELMILSPKILQVFQKISA